MAETKRKKTLEPANSSKRRKGGKEKNWKKGPHLPNALQKELNSLNPTYGSDEEIKSDDDIDVYEYEEKIPEEESKKNRRYDPVDNFEYELPKDFEDEDVASDDDEEEKGDSDDEKHARMLQDITGLPGDAFEGKKKKNDVVVFEAYPESEYNPSRDVLDGDGRITVDDLLNPLHGKPGFSKIRKDVQRIDKKSMSIQPPLPKPQQQKVDRRSAYVYSKKKLQEYESLVKKNREAPTIYFDEDRDIGYSTVGAIASEFKPRTEFEKKMASLINTKQLSEAHNGDGARLLELNKVSVQDVKERQDRLAKMRNLLFRHELKAKRIKHIKSKTYRRLMKKDKLKGASATEIEMNPEAAKQLAEKEEFKRAEERLTLKHKNTSKWAKRLKKRGFDAQDDGTRAAISQQLQQHALLTRKRNSMHDDESSSDDSTEDDDDMSADEDDDASKLKLLENGKNRTLEVLEEDDDMPKSGVLSLPFMVRGQKKKKEAAEEEARLALQDYESEMKQLDGDDDSNHNVSLSGRKVFGAQKKQAPQSKKKAKVNTDNYFDNSDSEDDDADTMEDVNGRMSYTQKDVNIDSNILREESEIGHDPLFKSFDDISKAQGPKIEYEVSLPATNSLKKKGNKKDSNQLKGKTESNKSQVAELASDKEEHDSDTDGEGEGGMVDGMITSGGDYELPSQDDLIRRAFAGDDVEEDFEMTKQEILNEENPEPEKPVLLPGWGQWTHIQKKRGLPSWMLAEHETAKKKRDQDLKKRPDAHLNHVIISQRVDKRAEKLQTKVLPYPFKDKEHFERSNRMPLGPEFNPATTIGSLNRPQVVKKPGVSIKPIKLRKH
ncbi:hypothetical protein L2E82_00037 [Cichorium intybus]|uniref:Uncharacterized protein n=1 Tax=Cichorium intybus TaxID=13427 RepID=A0ACB9GWE6_CICIN|nr:hypothetical protein L2E82_00037 [Cichorium intybus]